VSGSELLILFFLKNVSDAVENSETSTLWSSIDSSLHQTLSSDDSSLVEVTHSIQRMVSIFHLVHVPGGGSNVRSRYVDSWSNKVVLHQLDGVSSNDPLNFGLGELGLVHTDSSLSSSIRYFDHCKFETHQKGESFDLVHFDSSGNSGSSLGRELVLLVVASEGLESRVGSVVTN